MKRFDIYLLREGLAPFLFGLLLYSSLAIVSATLPRLQWIAGVPVVDLFYWLSLQLPTAVVQTLPIALLLAVLLAYGRLAAGSELLAIQAGGVAMQRITAVFLVMGIVSTGFALFLNQTVLPTTQAKVGSLYWELTTGRSGLFRLAKRDVPIGDYTLHFQRAGRDGNELFDVRVEAWQGERLTVFLAERARFVKEGLELFGYQLNVLDLSALDGSFEDAGALLRQLVRVDNRAARPEQSYTITTSESPEELITNNSQGGFEDTLSITEAYQDAHSEALEPPERRRASVLFHRKLAEPFANFTLLLIAVPLAVLYARSRAVAFGLSLVVTLAWYLLLTVGQLLAQTGALPVWLGLWGGNLVLAAAGAYLLLVRTNLR